jgi:hypothetical protein
MFVQDTHKFLHLCFHAPLQMFLIYVKSLSFALFIDTSLAAYLIFCHCAPSELSNQDIVVRLGSCILYFHLFISYFTSLRQEPSYILLILQLCRPVCMTYKPIFVIFIHVCTWKVTFIDTIITSNATMLFLH